MIYVGRLAVEKGIEDFLSSEAPGRKVIVGDGPKRCILETKYPEARFTGYLFGEDLIREMNAADVFAFPSKTDTFGLVMLEAMACGLPVAAYPITGPIDVVENGKSGCLDQDLTAALIGASGLSSADAIARAQNFTWQKTAHMLVENLARINLSCESEAKNKLPVQLKHQQAAQQ